MEMERGALSLSNQYSIFEWWLQLNDYFMQLKFWIIESKSKLYWISQSIGNYLGGMLQLFRLSVLLLVS